MDDLKHLTTDYFGQLALPMQDLPEAGEEEKYLFSPEEQHRRSEGARVALEKLISVGVSECESGGVSERPEWVETYRQLRELKMPWRVACYVAWASSPKAGRWPKNQDELAKQVMGLTSDRVFTTWRRKSPEIDEMVSLLQAAPLLEHRADVFQALARSASDPDHRSNPDRKLFLELTGDYTPKARLDMNHSADLDEVNEKSEKELLRMARRVIDGDDGDAE